MPEQCSRSFGCEGLLPFKECKRNKKLGEANQRCSMLAAFWDHLQGFASHPAFGQGAAGLKPVCDELPVIPQPAGGRAGTGAQES